MSSMIEIASACSLIIGSFLCLSGGLGLIRFPDFYTRMHAAGVTDTLAASLILIGLCLQSTDSLVVIKLLFILLMTLFINPSASHALANAALSNRLQPWTNNSKEVEQHRSLR